MPRRRPARSTTTRRFEGAQAIDRYTLRLKLTYPAYDLLADLNVVGDLGGCARSGQGLRRRERAGSWSTRSEPDRIG